MEKGLYPQRIAKISAHYLRLPSQSCRTVTGIVDRAFTARQLFRHQRSTNHLTRMGQRFMRGTRRWQEYGREYTPTRQQAFRAPKKYLVPMRNSRHELANPWFSIGMFAEMLGCAAQT
jgi:hypothetical protein